MKVKLCGFKEENSLKAAIAAKCDFIGFIFYEKSPRFVTIENAAKLAKLVPQSISKVAIVVDTKIEFLEEIAQKFSPQFFQFHGKESVEFLQKVKEKFPQIKIIKAFAINEIKDLQQIENFKQVADLFLFDGKNAGSGQKFDWEILHNFSCKKDWFLSGGLNINNIDSALEITGAKMIDISSGLEEIRGKKSVKLIADFMAKIRKYDFKN